MPAYDFHPLFCCNFPPFLIHVTTLLPKQFPISLHILIRLPSKLLIYLLFALIYEPFNLSLFFFVSVQTFLFYIFISGSHILLLTSPLSLNCSILTHHSTTNSLTSFLLLSVTNRLHLHIQPFPILPAPTCVRHYLLHSILLPSPH